MFNIEFVSLCLEAHLLVRHCTYTVCIHMLVEHLKCFDFKLFEMLYIVACMKLLHTTQKGHLLYNKNPHRRAYIF